MTLKNRTFVLLLASVSCTLLAADCSGSVITDPNFHTWSGDHLTSWKLESGEIRKAPTWHKNDFGVEFLDGTGQGHVTTISQTVHETPRCLEFSVLADVAAEAQVTIGVDFNADGTVEYEQPIAATGFREQKTQVTAPLAYVNIKFVISKRGSGRAVLAQMDVKSKDDCNAAPVALKPQALGTLCSLVGGGGAACVSGICCDNLCAECCGSANPPRDADGGLARDPEDTCSDGATCGRLPLTSLAPAPKSFGLMNGIPRQCDPGQRKRPTGSECLIAVDCASGACSGATWTLENTFASNGACAAPPLQDPKCNVSSVRGGRCK